MSPARTNRMIAAPPPMAPPCRPSIKKWCWKWRAINPFFAPTKCSTSITDLLVAIAPRVAKVTDNMVAMNIKIRIPMLDTNGGSRHCAHAVHPATMVVKNGAWCLVAQHAPQLRKVGRGTRRDLEHDQTRHGQLVEGKSAAQPRLEQFAGFLFRKRRDLCNSGKARAAETAFSTVASTSRPDAGDT